MERALDIPEILIEIFLYCDKVALYRLAHTCKGFAPFALDILWKHRTVTFHGLFHLFPEDLFQVRTQHSDHYRSFPMIRPLRSMKPSDWSKISERGPHIRHLLFNDNPMDQIRKHLPDSRERQWDVLFSPAVEGDKPPSWRKREASVSAAALGSFALHRPILHILPNLISLDWRSHTDHGKNAVLLFLSKSLRRTCIITAMFIEELFHNIHDRLDLEMPHELRLDTWAFAQSGSGEDYVYISEDGLHHLLGDFIGLEKLTLTRDFVTYDTFAIISGLPHLSHLSISGRPSSGTLSKFLKCGRTCLKTESAVLRSTSGSPSFPSLQSLELNASPEALTRLFDVYIHSTRLHTVKIVVNGNQAVQVRALFVAIAKNYPKLSVLHLIPDNSFYDFLENDVRSAEVYQKPHRMKRLELAQINMSILEPLLNLGSLTELVIDWPLPLRLGDTEDILKMALSWPHIRKLHLSPSPFFIPPERPRLVIDDLCAFNLFPELRELGVFFDGAAVEELPMANSSQVLLGLCRKASNMSLRSETTISKSLRILDPGRSWINNVNHAANILIRYFPDVRLPDWTSPMSRWKEVDMMLAK